MATTTAPAAHANPAEEALVTRADVSLDVVERAVTQLLAADKRALKLAADLPFLFRVPVWVNGQSSRRWARVTPKRFASLACKHRWGSRHLTRLYLETHVRRQLNALRACIRLELLGTTAADDRARLQAIEDELATRVPPLLGWRLLTTVAARVPTLAAAVPVVWAASVVPLDGVSVGSVGEALVVLGLAALAVWVLVVWPAVRLGFRVKRAILAGGKDIAHPFWDAAGKVEWSTLDVADVYEAESDAFAALGRRKPSELPLDMVLSFVPYLAFALLGFTVVGLVAAARDGFEGFTWDTLGGSLLLILILVLPFVFVRNAWRNSRARPH